MTASAVLGNSGTGRSSTLAKGEETYDPASIMRRRRRFDAGWLVRDLNAWLFPDQRVGTCGAPRWSAVMAERRIDGRVQIAGVETCGSVSGCLRCAAIIRAARAQEIDSWAKAHLATGGDLVFVTYTLPHVASDELAVLLDGMRDSWTAMNSGQGSMKVRGRFAIRGFIRSYEFTYGDNGWHPHLHVLYFVDGNGELHNEDSEPLAEMRSVLGPGGVIRSVRNSTGTSMASTASTPERCGTWPVSGTTSPRSISRWSAPT